MARPVTTENSFFAASVEERAWRLNRNGVLPAASTPMFLLEANDTNLVIQDLYAFAFEADAIIEVFRNPTIGTPFTALGPSDFLSNKVSSATRPQKSSITTSVVEGHVTDFGEQLDEEVLTESTTGASGKFYSESVGDDHQDFLRAGDSLLFKLTNAHLTVDTTIRFHLELEEDAFD